MQRIQCNTILYISQRFMSIMDGEEPLEGEINFSLNFIIVIVFLFIFVGECKQYVFFF